MNELRGAVFESQRLVLLMTEAVTCADSCRFCTPCPGKSMEVHHHFRCIRFAVFLIFKISL